MTLSLRVWSAGLLAVLLLAGTFLGRLPWLAGGLYLLMGCGTFVLFGVDKRAAERGDWRIPERTLHGLDLGFGIVGGLLAQQVFHHKTSKPGFRAVTWAITALHGAVLALIVCGVVAPATVSQAFSRF